MNKIEQMHLDTMIVKDLQSAQPKAEWEVEYVDGKLKLKS